MFCIYQPSCHLEKLNVIIEIDWEKIMGHTLQWPPLEMLKNEVLHQSRFQSDQSHFQSLHIPVSLFTIPSATIQTLPPIFSHYSCIQGIRRQWLIIPSHPILIEEVLLGIFGAEPTWYHTSITGTWVKWSKFNVFYNFFLHCPIMSICCDS
jgi:hypothetical protein